MLKDMQVYKETQFAHRQDGLDAHMHKDAPSQDMRLCHMVFCLP